MAPRLAVGCERSEALIDLDPGPVHRVAARVHVALAVPAAAPIGLGHREVEQDLTQPGDPVLETAGQKPTRRQDQGLGLGADLTKAVPEKQPRPRITELEPAHLLLWDQRQLIARKALPKQLPQPGTGDRRRHGWDLAQRHTDEPLELRMDEAGAMDAEDRRKSYCVDLRAGLQPGLLRRGADTLGELLAARRHLQGPCHDLGIDLGTLLHLRHMLAPDHGAQPADTLIDEVTNVTEAGAASINLAIVEIGGDADTAEAALARPLAGATTERDRLQRHLILVPGSERDDLINRRLRHHLAFAQDHVGGVVAVVPIQRRMARLGPLTGRRRLQRHLGRAAGCRIAHAGRNQIAGLLGHQPIGSQLAAGDGGEVDQALGPVWPQDVAVARRAEPVDDTIGDAGVGDPERALRLAQVYVKAAGELGHAHRPGAGGIDELLCTDAHCLAIAIVSAERCDQPIAPSLEADDLGGGRLPVPFSACAALRLSSVTRKGSMVASGTASAAKRRSESAGSSALA